MRRLANLLATVGGLGYAPVAPGTAGSLAGFLIAWATASLVSPRGSMALVLLGCGLGVVVSGMVAQALRDPDPSIVVIDECLGMWLVCALVPQTLHVAWVGVAAFGLFRAFDIVKVPPLKQLERLPGGWGIMLDDLGAAAYTCLVLWIVQKVMRM